MGEVSVYSVGLPSTTQAVDAGYPASSAFTVHPRASQVAAGRVVLLLGHHASEHVQRGVGRPLPHPLPPRLGLSVCLHRRGQHLHVRVRGDEVILAVPLRGASVRDVYLRGLVHHPVQCVHREYRRGVGVVQPQVPLLCGL